MTRTQVREHLFKLLFRVEFNPEEDMDNQVELFFTDSPADAEEDYDSVGADIPEADAEYIRVKYNGIIQKRDAIDEQINKAAKGWTTDRLGKVELAILRLATYEMLYDESIPVGVAIDEAVDLAKKFAQDGASSFVNGILSGVLKQNDLTDK